MDYDDKREEAYCGRIADEEEQELMGLSADEYTLREYKKYGIDIYGYGSDGYTALDFEKRESDQDILGYDRKGYKNDFDVNGINRYTGTEYDTNGYNVRGFNEEGICIYTGTEYDENGFNKDGFNSNGEHYKSNIPYYKIARDSLLSWNKDLTEEQVQQIIETSSIADLEDRVGAKNSIKYAIQGIVDSLLDEKLIGVSEARYYFSDLASNIFEGKESDRIDNIREYLDRMEDKDDFIVENLSKVHDGWVKDNPHKFFQQGRNRQFQHLPIALIGWKETKSDLVFVKPIFEKLGITIDEKRLESKYNERSAEFLGRHKINSADSLKEAISEGDKFYPALSGQDNIIAKLADSEFVETTLIPQIAEKGFGSVEKMKQYAEIYDRTGITIRPEDMQKALATVKMSDFRQATSDIKENSKEKTSKDEVSLDD